MFRLSPLTFSALQIGITSAAVYIVCSGDILSGAFLFLAH